MSGVYVKKVFSKTLKGGVDATLGACTLIIGPNGSGKTRVVNAIELALTGRISDWRGRGVSAEAAALKSLGARATNAGEEGEESDGFGARKAPKVDVEIEPIGGGPSLRVTGSGKSAPFPDAILLRDVEDAVAGSANTLRKFLVKHAVGIITREDVLARLPLQHRAAYTDAVGTLGGPDLDEASDAGASDGELDLLVAVIKYSEKRARTAAADVKACSNAINNAPAAPAPSAEEVQGASARARDAQTALEKRIAAQAGAHATAQAAARTSAAHAQAHAARVNKRRELSARITALVEAHPAFAGLAPPMGAAAPVPFSSTFDRNLASLRQHVADNATKCLVCGTAKTHEELATRLALVEAKIAEREFHLLSAQLRELNELFKAGDAAGAAPVASSGVSQEEIDTARRLLTEAQAGQRALDVRALAWEGIEKARARAGECEKLQGQFEALAKASGEVVKALFAAGRSKFVARVQAAMPVGFTFGLELSETRLDFGLVDAQGELRTALSGAEWVRVMGAIALAIADSGIAGGASSPKILIPPDRSLDAASLTGLMEAWREFPARAGVQVIITSANAPSKFVEGWTVIKTGELPRGAEEAREVPRAISPARKTPTVLEEV